MQKHLLSEKEKREIKKEIKEKYCIEIDGKFEVGKEKKEIMYFINDMLSFITNNKIPTLCFILKYNPNLPSVIIDDGAVKALINGADLFVPGILSYDCECKPGDVILAKNKNGAPIAVLKVIMNKEDAITTKKGKFSENLHYLGDKYWEVCKEFI